MTEQIIRLAGKSDYYRCACVSKGIRSVEDLETLPAGTKTRGHHTIEERGVERGKRSTTFLGSTRKGHRVIRPVTCVNSV